MVHYDWVQLPHIVASLWSILQPPLTPEGPFIPSEDNLDFGQVPMVLIFVIIF